MREEFDGEVFVIEVKARRYGEGDSFNVDIENESYKEKGIYMRRLVGYKFCHIMKVEGESDNDRLVKILYALVKLGDVKQIKR